jgi:predicted nucleic acid-binding protein
VVIADVSIRDLRDNAADVVDRAARGEQIRITRAGKPVAHLRYDAMIAATAIANDLPVYTCNPADFSGIDDLEVIAVLESGAHT